MSSFVGYVKGDLFQLTKEPTLKPLLLAHACNCMGVWGGGIAFAFKQRFTSAYKIYHKFCTDFRSDPSSLLGKSLLIPVSPRDSGFVKGAGEKLLIVCLFTSVMGEESAHEIATNTKNALLDLKKQLADPTLVYDKTARSIVEGYESKTEELTVNMPKINAGIFGVPWELTENALKSSGLPCRVFVL
ncbi:DEKNAAC102575 [Brettanomyces naardenensis]|uniref:ADP-ribose 1''-phosphate phosphatase n=1 Tax=Brettanomyces naardenensis TaxID=13370 RepID=A0A448YKC0_BRENA|nr:DEKNAAC102575 [Brettanomyces naardenensis]